MRTSGIAVQARQANGMHAMLAQKQVFDYGKKPLRRGGCVVFPLKKGAGKSAAAIARAFPGARLTRAEFTEREAKPRTIREALRKKLSAKELALVPSSFDLLGDVAIIELPKGIAKKAKKIGEALMRVNKSVESVYLKTGAHKGVFRSEPVRLVAGRRKKFATYREHGCVFRVSIGKVFFSPRLSTERKRIASLIMPGEKIAALFAGVGPFPIVFAKNSGMASAAAIELNPAAVDDMEENIRLNKAENKVEAVLGDVKGLSRDKNFAGLFDRAVMPLPKGGEDFLEDAIRYIKPSGGVVHYYQFVSRDDPYTIPLRQIAAACEKLGRKFGILFSRKVREYAPDTIQVVVDFRVFEA
ncbi:MAG: class I SAM-dependent methyltransferase family protein [Candidatus Diapherotrites archaeon]|uniref:Class I SAM-dependent methyltransferase family protein n=1 Tax=Candidatus Iainarchaeum sp. TaxID=3101447 RepID=A0A8T3YIV1_9ARCH|nr:class I SAM-dependent methyltransferase family protein [Candidatus Diapherotrites archaeon]